MLLIDMIYKTIYSRAGLFFVLLVGVMHVYVLAASDVFANKNTITHAEIRTVIPPAAGHYPTSFFQNPYRPNSTVENSYHQTIVWEPNVTRTFALNTVYTAIIRLTPREYGMTFQGIPFENVSNLPEAGEISYRLDGDDLLVYIAFEVTDAVWSPPIELFFDDFSQGLIHWENAPEENRHNLSMWQNDQVSLVDDQLVLRFEKNPSLAPPDSYPLFRDNFIAAGAVRTRSASGSDIFFENAYGFYEARIRFPQVDGMWGSFRLVNPDLHNPYYHGAFAADINIVETLESARDNGFNVSWQWGLYEDALGRYGPPRFSETAAEGASPIGINIFDGEFHTFALDWSPTEYVFLVNSQVVYRSSGHPVHEVGGISQNPNFLELSIEAAPWVGIFQGVAADAGYMVIDYVRVLNGPKYDFDLRQSIALRTINAPVAGHFPAAFFHNPFRENTAIENDFTQTLTWYPEVTRAFETDTVYTATVRLTPRSAATSFYGITLYNIGNLPDKGVKSFEYDANDMLIHIVFDATASEKAQPEILFSDDFSQGLNQWARGPQWRRQGLSMWQDDQSNIVDNQLVLGFEHRPHLAPDDAGALIRNNYVAAGAVRTRSEDGREIFFENAFGFYEARIKFPQIDGVWGAFWLLGPTMGTSGFDGVMGKEIDIVETFNSHRGNSFNIAWHWNGYGAGHREYGPPNFSGTYYPGFIPVGIDIYDGEFHTFALEWNPTEYIFMVNGQVIYRTNAQPAATYGGILQNPNYLKLSMEASVWAGTLEGISETSGYMVVDYVRVWNGPRV